MLEDRVLPTNPEDLMEGDPVDMILTVVELVEVAEVVHLMFDQEVAVLETAYLLPQVVVDDVQIVMVLLVGVQMDPML
jgi:hypothetical protein